MCVCEYIVGRFALVSSAHLRDIEGFLFSICGGYN